MPIMTRDQYQSYLKSDHWKALRAKKLSKSSKRCAICASAYRLEVHHLSYKNITDVETADLRVLCHRCHDLFHALQRNGVICIKPGSPHSIFAQTQNALKKVLGITKPTPKNPIQKELAKHITPNGGFTSATLKSFGVSWPPKKGWTKKLVLENGKLVYKP